MKVIDLLNRIANDEEVPELVKYNGMIYNYVGIYRHGLRYVELNETDVNFRYLIFNINNLNDEVEIIEEDKKIEKLPYYSLEKIQKAKNKEEHIEERIQLLEKRMDDYHNKINEIINKLNEVENKND